MPLVFKKEAGQSVAGLWEIQEDIPYFESFLPYKSPASHPEKIKQQLAARMALRSIKMDFPFHDVEVLEGGKPALKESELKFSLSHCNGFAAAIVSNNEDVGIDIEPVHERVLKVEKKFLHEHELAKLEPFNLSQRIEFATLFWTLKEALYKWWGSGGIDFSTEMKIEQFDIADKGCASMKFSKLPMVSFELEYFMHNNIWVTTLCKSKSPNEGAF